MMKWRSVHRCKVCGKVYPDDVSEICYKCGIQIAHESSFLEYLGASKTMVPTDNLESVIAKRTLFGWKFKKENMEENKDEFN